MTTPTITSLLNESIAGRATIISSRSVPTRRGQVSTVCVQREDGALWVGRIACGHESVEPMPLSTLEVIMRFPRDSITWQMLDFEGLTAFVARQQALETVTAILEGSRS